jgi:general secretion pathway protein F
MKFAYDAVDEEGRPQSGETEAPGPAEATAALARSGLQVTALRPREPGWRGLLFPTSPDEVASVCDQLARLTETGMPLPEALEALSRDARGRGLREALERIAVGLREGRSLPELLEREGPAFPPLLPALVLAGQESGSLSETLRLAASHAWRLAALRAHLRGALAYPVFVLLLLFGLVVGLLPQLVPNLNVFLQDMSGFQSTPLTTRMVLWVGSHPGAVAGASGAAVLLLWVLWRACNHVPDLARAKQWVLFHLPIYGRLLRASYLARFCRTLGLFLEAGVPLARGLRVMAAVDRRAYVPEAAGAVAGAVERGEAFSNAILVRTDVFPAVLSAFALSGEKTGRLPEVLQEASRLYEEEARHEAEVVRALLPPILVVLVGGLVFGAVRALLLPLLQLIANLGG